MPGSRLVPGMFSFLSVRLGDSFGRHSLLVGANLLSTQKKRRSVLHRSRSSRDREMIIIGNPKTGFNPLGPVCLWTHFRIWKEGNLRAPAIIPAAGIS